MSSKKACQITGGLAELRANLILKGGTVSDQRVIALRVALESHVVKGKRHVSTGRGAAARRSKVREKPVSRP